MADDSKTSNVGGRYAQALFDLATDEKSVATVEADLKSLKKMRAESKDFRTLLGSPAFSAGDKGKALAANGRVAILPEVIAGFEALSAKRRGVVSAQVTTAIALTAAQAKGVSAALRTALGQDPEIETRVDPSILGGIKVRVGSRLFDASLRSKLDSLKFALKRA